MHFWNCHYRKKFESRQSLLSILANHKIIVFVAFDISYKRVSFFCIMSMSEGSGVAVLFSVFLH